MSEIVESYQQERAAQPQEAQPYSFATVAGVYNDGLSLIWPGEKEATKKHYKCNTVAVFSSGQRVFVAKDSGSYVVLFPIGNPGSGKAPGANYASNANSAKTAGTATSAGNANTAKKADNATNAEKAKNADNATKAETALKVGNTGTRYSDIEFRALYTNQLEFRIGSSSWNKLQNQK